MELVFYILLGLVLGRGPRVAVVWLLASIAYHIWLSATEADWEQRYPTVQAASLPFSIGSVAYWGRKWIADHSKPWHGLVIGGLLCVNLVTSLLQDRGTSPVPLQGFYINLVLMTALVCTLSTIKAGSRSASIDGRLGDLSYPMYLLHWQVGLGIHAMTGHSRGLVLFSLSYVGVFVAAALMNALIDSPIERLGVASK